MQTQVQQMSKKNKVTVPFYSPPFRLHGQTSADIIKEARAAVMTPSPVSIKPIHTSRPFTPNEKERTLFGRVKKDNSRPPSSFSLRHLKTQEPTSRVKLPSIHTVSRKKKNSSFYSKNLSLDNLTEDYDAETSEEISSSDQERLPTWKKAHSCPKEGRLSKVVSLNDISPSFIDGKNCYDVNREQHSESFDTATLDTSRDSSDLNVFETSGDHFKSKRNEIPFASQNPIMTKGGGDYEVPSHTEKDFSDVDVHQLKEKLSENFPVEKEKDNKSEENLDLEKPSSEERLKPSMGEEEKQINETNEAEKSITVAEKSVTTESISEYLTSLKSGFKSPDIVKHFQSVPSEILELYETARFYGVDVTQSGNGNSSSDTSSVHSQSVTNAENVFGKKITEYSEQSDKPEKSEEVLKSNEIKKVNRETCENVEFVMNNKKRYHTVSDKGGVQEKSYKIWNRKEEKSDEAPQTAALSSNWDLFWKNSYYKEKNDQEETVKKNEGQGAVQKLVNKISEIIKKGADNRKLYQTTSELYNLIKSDNLVLDSKLKKNILRSLYLCVDIENAEVLLSIAKIFLYLKDENSLSVACKIIFKVARFDTNDFLFLREEDILELFLEGIGRASPLDCAESCIYSYGALKFLTLNHNILSRILNLGALDLMALHLKLITNAHIENGSVGEQTHHALFQLTGALRHVAAGEGALPLFLTTNSITIVCSTLRCFSKDEDVVVNISRTLSLLSTDEIVTQALMQVENILSILIDLMERYKENDKILIRLAFCLGNIVEHSDLARVQLSRSDTAMTVLLNILKLYIDKDLEISLREDNCSEELNAEVVDDVIVKVIRIIANMSMNPIVGSNLSPTAKEKKSLQLSKLLSTLLMRKDPGITLLATLGCLNNISYYCNTHSVLVDLTQGVERVLGLDSVECQTEAARVLGNLTRHQEIRDLIYSTGGVDLLMKLLSSPDQEVVKSACGALVNMLLDSETRKHFVEAQGIDKLVKTLEVFPDDWSLASVVARAIWNSCGDDVSSAVMHNNMENLLNLLTSSLEEENWNDGDVAWEEFASVATDLLEKISLHFEST